MKEDKALSEVDQDMLALLGAPGVNEDDKNRLFDHCIKVGLESNTKLLRAVHQRFVLNGEFDLKARLVADIGRVLVIDDNTYAKTIYRSYVNDSRAGVDKFVSAWFSVLIDVGNHAELKACYLELMQSRVTYRASRKTREAYAGQALSPETEKTVWNALVRVNPHEGVKLFSALILFKNIDKEDLLQSFAYWLTAVNTREDVMTIYDSVKHTFKPLDMSRMAKAVADNRILALELAMIRANPQMAIPATAVDSFLKSSHSRFFKCMEPAQSSWEIHGLIAKHEATATACYNATKVEAEEIINHALSKDEGRRTHFEFNR
jgi:hypothetical protein